MSSNGPNDPPPPPGGPGNPPPSSYPQQGYGGPPGMAGSYTPQNDNQGRVFTIIAFVCGVIAFIFCPPLFGTAGIILGVIGNQKGDPLAKWAIVLSVAGLIFGFVIAYLFFYI